MQKFNPLYPIFLTTYMCVSGLVVQGISQSQPYPFKQYPLPHDLPAITLMQEDHEGYIWIGTMEGLYRFDGVNYTHYGSLDPSKGLGREHITTIIEDDKHQLWIGARSGVYLYQKLQKDFKKFALDEETFAYYIYPENDSTLLVQGIHGIFLVNTNSNHWDKLDVGIDHQKIYVAQRGIGNDLWIGSDDVVRKYHLVTKTFEDINIRVMPNIREDEKIRTHSMFMDSRQHLWINTWYKGVIKLDTRTHTMVTFESTPSDQPYLLEYFNPSMAEDKDGNVWLASHGAGINIYQPVSGKISHIIKGEDYGFGLTGTSFSVMADDDKNMWVSSDRSLHYVSKFSPVPQLVSHLSSELTDAMFVKFLQPDYAIAGTYFGLYGIHTGNGKVTNLNTSIQLPMARDAELQTIPDIYFFGKNNFWITSPQGLRKVNYSLSEKQDPVLHLEELYPTRKGFWPTRFFPVNDSLMFIKGRTNTSVFAIFNTKTEKMDYHILPDSLLINQASLYKNNTIFIAVRNKGLYSYNVISGASDFVQWNLKDRNLDLVKPVFYDIRLLSDGKYALCTENYGLLLFDPNDNTISQIDVASVANTNIIFTVDEDADHHLWLQAANQLLHYNRDTKTLSKTNLANSFKGQNPLYILHEGKELYTVFEGGLYRIGLNELFSKNQKPKLYLQDLKAGNRSLTWSHDEPIRLNYTDNFVSYSFTGIDYDNPQGIRYWYQIPEISNEWIGLEKRTTISTRLSPGNYHFVVKASNDAGLWSDEINSPPIIISPPLWKRGWFVLGLLGVAAGITAYLIRLRQTKKVAELRLRNQIARDLHDDIGSTLSGIKIFSTIASDMSGHNKDLSSLLNQIRDKSDLMMQSMSDIVWSINPAYDSLHDMMIRLKQYMSEVLESQNIDVEVITNTDLKNQKISLEHRKDLYLALKEIINNAAKHASCKNVKFEVSREQGDIIFRIADDGVGMNEQSIVLGNGLKNIDARIRQIDGTIRRESSEGHGTTYEIRVSLKN